VIRDLTITVLVDDTVVSSSLLSEHGLSLWVKADGHQLLFDTGQGRALLRNASTLGVPLELAETIILSHGHFDHVGGVEPALELCRSPMVLADPEALRLRYVRDSDGSVRQIGTALVWGDLARRCRPRLDARPTHVTDDMVLSGRIPQLVDYEDTGDTFFLDEGLARPDRIEDEQALVLNGPSGLVVLMGCAHRGVVNTLRYVTQFFPDRPVAGVLGGMHLARAGPGRLRATIAELRRLKVARVAAGHCTGQRALRLLAEAYQERFRHLLAGTTVAFGAEDRRPNANV